MTNPTQQTIEAIVAKEAEYAEAVAVLATEERTVALQIELDDLYWEMNEDVANTSVYA